MAKKSKEKIKNCSERLYRLKAEYLKTNPEFQEDIQRFYSICCSEDDINKKMNKIREIKLEVYKKYNLWVPYPPIDSSDWKKLWANFDKPSIRIIEHKPRFIIPKGKITKAKFEKFDRSIEIWGALEEKKPDERIKRTLRENKYLALEIDTDIDKDVIIDEIKNYLVWVKNERKKYGLDKSPIRKRMDNYTCYLKVYNTVEQAKNNKNFSWGKIANMFYKNDTGGFSYAIRKVKRDYERGKRLLYMWNVDK